MKVLLIAAFAAIVTSPVLAATSDSPSTSDLFAKARAEFNAQLNDYPSARFRDVHIIPGINWVCGWVNAKNELGGYAGWLPFLYSESSPGQQTLMISDMLDTAPTADYHLEHRDFCLISGDSDHSAELKSPS